MGGIDRCHIRARKQGIRVNRDIRSPQAVRRQLRRRVVSNAGIHAPGIVLLPRVWVRYVSDGEYVPSRRQARVEHAAGTVCK